MIQVGTPRFYQPVGRCIYCGTAEEPLSDEHILPFALGGNLILPKASCETHRKTTQRIERTCATKMFGAYRVRVGGPTQNPGNGPTRSH